MTKIKYIEFNGTEHEADVANGLSVMEGAIQNDIPNLGDDQRKDSTQNKLLYCVDVDYAGLKNFSILRMVKRAWIGYVILMQVDLSLLQVGLLSS